MLEPSRKSLFGPQSELSLQYAFKYVRSNFDGEGYTGYTDLIGVDFRRGFGRRFDAGINTSIYHSWESDVVDYGLGVDVYDPWVDPEEARNEYHLDIISYPERGGYDGLVLAVAHRDFIDMELAELQSFLKPRSVIFDVKNILPPAQRDGAL